MKLAIHQKNTAPGRPVMLLLGVLLCALATPATAAKLYKWVDEDGKVRYSDRLPAQEKTSSGHQQLNSQGLVLSTTDAAKSSEELAEEAEAARKLEEEQKKEAQLKAEQQREDRVLLMTFASAEEIEHARDSRMEVLDSVIRLIESSIETTQQKLDGIQKSADRNYVSQGKEIPGGVAQKIEHFERKIENRNAQLQAKEAEKEKIRQKYEADLERFQELKSASN